MHPQPVSTLSGSHPLARVFHPMFALYAGVLAGAALVFDLLYLLVGGGLLMAALYTLPITAGLVACLVAAADELRLDRQAVKVAIALAASAGLTNALYLAAIGAMRQTAPDHWLTGAGAVVLSAAAVLSAAYTALRALQLIRITAPADEPRRELVDRIDHTLVDRVDPTLIERSPHSSTPCGARVAA